MIKFFRQIRQDLLMENKISKYFKYAIGEIILVVIGILIALQINNWNISKQDAIFERKILFDLKKSIENDLKQFKETELRVVRRDQAIDTILLYRNNRISLSEDELRKYNGRVGLGILLSYDKAVFETLKTSGLQKVTSDTLKEVITRHYEVRLPRFQEFIDDNYNYYKPLMDKSNEKLKQIGFYESYFEPDEDSTRYYIRRHYDFSKIFTKEYKEHLLLNSEYKKADWGRIRSAIRYTEQVLKLLNKEIESRYQDEL